MRFPAGPRSAVRWSSVAVFVDAAHLYLFLSYEQRRSGPHILNLLPSFYDDGQYLGFLLFSQGETLGQIVYNIVGATPDRRCLGRGTGSCAAVSPANATEPAIKISNENIRFIGFSRYLPRCVKAAQG